jgi:hypothetical protein
LLFFFFGKHQKQLAFRRGEGERINEFEELRGETTDFWFNKFASFFCVGLNCEDSELSSETGRARRGETEQVLGLDLKPFFQGKNQMAKRHTCAQIASFLLLFLSSSLSQPSF